MSTKRYDREGNLIGYSVSSGETARQNATNAALLVLLVLLIMPIAPILLAGLYVFSYSHQELNFHGLFSIIAGLITIGVGIWILVKFPVLRRIYFTIYAAAVGVLLFLAVEKNSDEIWASFWALVVVALLYFYFRFIDAKLM